MMNSFMKTKITLDRRPHIKTNTAQTRTHHNSALLIYIINKYKNMYDTNFLLTHSIPPQGFTEAMWHFLQGNSGAEGRRIL